MSGAIRSLVVLGLVATGCGRTVTMADPDSTSGTTAAADGDGGPTSGAPGDATTTDDGPAPGDDTDDDGSASGDGFGTAYEDDGGSDDGCTFTCPTPPNPPGGGGGGSFECDLERQDCPEGEKCMPWANDGGTQWNATRCSPIDPDPGAPGDACAVEGSFVSGIDYCEQGAMCLPDDFDPSDGMGTCAAFCAGACPDPGDACLPLFFGIPLCTRPCDPLDDAACPDGRACVPLVPLDGHAAFVCQPSLTWTTVEDGTPCELTDACGPGRWCAPAADVPGCEAALGCCARLCDAQSPAPTCIPAGGQMCVPIGGQPGTMWEALGICIVP